MGVRRRETVGCLNPGTSRAQIALGSRSSLGLSPAEPGTVLKAGLGVNARYRPCCRLSHAPFSFVLVQSWSNGRKESVHTSAAGSNAPSLARGRHSSVKPFTRSSAMWWQIGWTARRKR